MQSGLTAGSSGLKYSLEPIRVGGGAAGMAEPPPLGQLADFMDAGGPSRATAVVECPKSMVGRVIGKGGETIKALQQYTGAMIQIDQSCDPTRVTIAGLPQALHLAVSMVNDIVRGTFKGFAMLRQIAVGSGVGSSGGTTPGAAGSTPLSGAMPSPVYVQGYGFVPPSQAFGSEEALAALLRATPSSAPGTPPIAPLRGATGAVADPAAAAVAAAAAAAATAQQQQQQQAALSPDLAAALLAGAGVQRSVGSVPGSPYGVQNVNAFVQQGAGSFAQQQGAATPSSPYAPAGMSAYGTGLGASGVFSELPGLAGTGGAYGASGLYGGSGPAPASPHAAALGTGLGIIPTQHQQQQAQQQASAFAPPTRGPGLEGLDGEAVLAQLLSQLAMGTKPGPAPVQAVQVSPHGTPPHSVSPGPGSGSGTNAVQPMLDAAGLQTLLAQAALLSRTNAAAAGEQGGALLPTGNGPPASSAFAAPGGLSLGMGPGPELSPAPGGLAGVNDLLLSAAFGAPKRSTSPLAGSGRASPPASGGGGVTTPGASSARGTPSKTRSASSMVAQELTGPQAQLAAGPSGQPAVSRTQPANGR